MYERAGVPVLRISIEETEVETAKERIVSFARDVGLGGSSSLRKNMDSD